MDETSQPRSQRTGRILAKRSRPGGPVTCVSFHPDGNGESSILAARGPYLERSRTSGETDRFLVFPGGGIIHGVRYAGEDQATPWNSIVFGGKLLAFCDLACTSKMTRIGIIQNDKPISHLKLMDWIWDVKFISSKDLGSSFDSTFFAVGMARHIVELWKVDASLQVSHQLRIHGQPSCQVTSMDIRFSTEDRLVTVAAGTSFQEIAVWSQELQVYDGIISTSTEYSTRKSNSLHGHAGVVHAVRFSADGQALASTSDDRSVRYWLYDKTKREWSLKWVGWGHTARVWSVSFVPSLSMVASVAEDGTTRLWSCETGEAKGCIQHSSSLWKIDTLETFAVTGATDGTIQCYDLSSRTWDGDRLVDIEAIAVPDDRPTITDEPNEEQEEPKLKKPKKKKKKVPTQVIVGMQLADITSDCPVLLVATREGSLMKLHVDSKEWSTLEPWWTESLEESHDIRSTDGCCMGLHSGQIAIGTSRGDIVHIRPTGSYQLLSARRLKSVQGLKWIDAATLISFHVSSVAVWHIDSSKDVLNPAWICELEGKRGVPLSCAYEKERLIVGDSRGILWFFPLAAEGSSGDSKAIQSSSTLPRAHQKEHILDVAFRGNKVYSVGNDGCLHIAYVNGNQLSKGWSVPASSMTGICKLWGQLDGSGFLVSGYYGNTYRMVDMRTGHELFQIDTGGRQRSLHCAVEAAPEVNGAEVLSKYAVAVCMNNKDGTNSTMIRHLKGQEKSKLSVPKTVAMGVNMHSETIFDVCLFQIRDSILVLTGSEDCTSKLSMYDSGSLIDSTLLTPQESSVKAVCSSQYDDSSAIVVVGGGKLILQFFLVRALGESCTSINDLQIQFLGQSKNRDKATIDHRINTVKALPIADRDSESSRKHLVVAGDSDGCCHLFIVSEDDESEMKVSRGVLVGAGDRPILSIDLCPIGNRILVALGNTGGDVLLFDLPGSIQDIGDELSETLKPFSSYHAHQMGTNALNILPAKQSGVTDVTICTGGDDQALGMCTLSFCKYDNDDKLSLAADPVPQVTKELSFSALKGVSQFWHDKERYLLTVGYTQRLALWHCGGLELTNETPSLLDAASVDLGDVNCLGVLKVPTNEGDSTGTKVLVAVGGMGVELMEFPLANL